MKRSIQTSKPGNTVGIEYDHLAIRCACLATDGRGGFTVEKLEEIRGDFSEDLGLLDGLRKLKGVLNIGIRDSVVSCLAGKQVFAAEIPFRKLGPEEMEQALRLELRKTVHFEVATSSLDYELISTGEDTEGGVAQFLVALASNTLLNRQLSLMEKAGIKTTAVDVLPIAIANAIWAWKGSVEGNHPMVALHIGPQVSTIVIDAEHSPFFNRTIYFAAEDVFKPLASQGDREKRIQSLCEEVARSLIFYEKQDGASGFQEILILGDSLDGEGLANQLHRVTGIPVRKMDLPAKLGAARKEHPGRFDLAIALALRGEG
ncbi:MAG: pilus assembly protein PilM [Fibrobacterota bacterium]|nr:pilus assembly protein PilM [Fibrobacterota bacterium]